MSGAIVFLAVVWFLYMVGTRRPQTRYTRTDFDFDRQDHLCLPSHPLVKRPPKPPALCCKSLYSTGNLEVFDEMPNLTIHLYCRHCGFTHRATHCHLASFRNPSEFESEVIRAMAEYRSNPILD